MRCKSNRCKSDNFTQSHFLANFGYCPDCETHTRLNESDVEKLTKEGGLKYEDYQASRMKAKEEALPQNNKKKSSRKKKKKSTKKVKEVKLECDAHPKYGVIRKPRTDCKQCWAAYEAKFPDRVGTK